MAAAWEMEIPQTEKMVLLCLCDHANDSGECWPSVARIAYKCSVTDRTVQKAIQGLKARGILAWHDDPGRSHRFVINPRRIFTPENASPPKMTAEPPKNIHPTPENASPKPSITIKEPPKSNKAQKPDCVSDEVWRDFQELRRVKKAPLTPTALKKIEAEAALAGWSLENALSECSARGWQGFNAKWVKETERENRNSTDGRDGVAKALDRRLGLGQSSGETGRRNIGGSREDGSGSIARLADLR